MENYIVLDGRKFGVTDSFAEVLRGVIKEKEKNSPFERVDGTEYYFIADDGYTEVKEEENDYTDDMHHKIGNYCSDIELMRQRALHETLNRLLWRYRETCDKGSPWDGEHQHWCIVNREGEFTVDFTITHHIQGVVYFSLRDNAIDAIDNVVVPFMKEYPDFVW